jgi:hypothetical protein
MNNNQPTCEHDYEISSINGASSSFTCMKCGEEKRFDQPTWLEQYKELTKHSQFIEHAKIENFIREKQKECEERCFESYKQGVKDEIECVETSGEHIDLQKNLNPKSDCM